MVWFWGFVKCILILCCIQVYLPVTILFGGEELHLTSKRQTKKLLNAHLSINDKQTLTCVVVHELTLLCDISWTSLCQFRLPRDGLQSQPITAHHLIPSSQIVNLSQCAMPSIQMLAGLIYPNAEAINCSSLSNTADAFFCLLAAAGVCCVVDEAGLGGSG